MIFYILLFIITIGLLLSLKKSGNAKIVFIILWMIYAFRDNVGVDDRNYIQVFEYLKLGWGYDVEWSYLVLCKVAMALGMNYKFCFLVYGTLSMILLYKATDIFFETNYNKAIYLACFWGTVFVSSVSVMRQFLAACFCFFAVALLYKEGKLFKPLVLCIIGIVFHMGAVVAIPVLLLMKSDIVISYSNKIIIVILCVACGYLNITNTILNAVIRFVPNSYQIYSESLEGSYSSAGGTLSLLLLGMYLIQCIISKRAGLIEPISQMEAVIEKGQLAYIGILFFFVHSGVASRLAFTFLLFSATIPMTFTRRIVRGQRQLVTLVMFVGMFLLMFMTLNSVVQLEQGGFIPYNASLNFWN